MLNEAKSVDFHARHRHGGRRDALHGLVGATQHPKLPATTRRRIQAIAEQLGYRPDPVVSRILAAARARRRVRDVSTLAFLTCYPSRHEPKRSSQLVRDYIAGAAERARQLGYRLEEIWAKEPGMTGRRLTALLLARGIRGVLIAPLPVARGHLSLDWSQLIPVALGYTPWKPDLPRVAVNHHQCALIALRHLKRLGYRRPGLVMSAWSDERVDYHWSGAVLAHQYRSQAKDRMPPLIRPRLTESAIQAWVEKHLPDIVLSNSSAVWHLLERAGRRVPQDIGFVHLHQEEARENCAGVHHNGREVGAAAVEVVAGKLQRNELGLPPRPPLVLIDGYWVDGKTVRLQRR